MSYNADGDGRSHIDRMMKRFKLVDMREQYEDIIEEARREHLDYEDFLIRLLEAENDGKNDRRARMLLKKACFETDAELSGIDYEFNQTLDRDRIEEFGQLAATAILDRLLHHCHVVSITGDSYRVKGAKRAAAAAK